MPRDRPRPLPSKIQILDGAFCPQIDTDHYYVIAEPWSAGVRSLLLVSETLDGKRVFRDVLAAMPDRATERKDVPKYQQALFKSALAVVMQHYKEAVRAMDKLGFVENLPAEFIDDRLYGDALPSWLQEWLERLRGKVANLEPPPSLLAEFDDLLGRGLSDNRSVKRWSPLHLRDREIDAKNNLDWHIFESWEEWDQEKLGRRERSTRLYGRELDSKDLDNFYSKLDYLSLKTPRNHRHNRYWVQI